jgi:hypothetical protein
MTPKEYAKEQSDVGTKLNPTFDFSLLNVDCQICGANSKFDEIEDSICPKCGEVILIPISYK